MHKTIYGGFHPKWVAGKLEREITDNIAKLILEKFPNKQTSVVVTSWHTPTSLIKQLQELNCQETVLCSFTDPLGPIENFLDQLPGNVHLVGYTNSKTKFDFWAVACLNFFKKYKEEQIDPTHFDYLYLNYNRKPHAHRRLFVRLLERSNLITKGCLTLGNSKYNVNDSDAEYSKFGAKDIIGNIGIPNDIYSLGQIDLWTRSFINIVSETQYEYSPHVFLSEKIYKPIIGMRPFMINGSPGIYRWLKAAGFDCFEDLFPVDRLSDETELEDRCKFANHQIIIETLQRYQSKDLIRIYQEIKPRLQRNREYFYEYANKQYESLSSLDFG